MYHPEAHTPPDGRKHDRHNKGLTRSHLLSQKNILTSTNLCQKYRKPWIN